MDHSHTRRVWVNLLVPLAIFLARCVLCDYSDSNAVFELTLSAQKDLHGKCSQYHLHLCSNLLKANLVSISKQTIRTWYNLPDRGKRSPILFGYFFKDVPKCKKYIFEPQTFKFTPCLCRVHCKLDVAKSRLCNFLLLRIS